MKQYKVVDLSYSQDPRRHLKDVAAYHELDGWRLLSVVHLHESCRWLYYMERDATAGPDPRGGVASAAAGGEQSLPEPVRRVEGGGHGEAATSGADVASDGVTVEVMGRPPLTLDEFRRLTWEQTGEGVVTADPAHVPVIEEFLAAKNDPEKLRAFIEQELGGEWREEPYAGQEAEEPGPIEYRAQQPCECHLPKGERRFRQDAALEPQCVPCWARARLEQATSGFTGPS